MRSEMITVKDHLSIVADKDAEIRTLRSELEQSRARCEALRDGIRARRALEGDAEARRPVSSDELKGTAYAIASELDTAISESSTARVVDMLASIAGRPIAPEPVDEAEIERAAEPLFRHFLLGDNDDAANAEMIRNALRAIARRPLAIDEAALLEAIHGAVNEHMDELIDEPEETTNDDAVKRILSAIRPLLTAPAAAMNEASAEGGE